jgi:subtilase family serine protease
VHVSTRSLRRAVIATCVVAAALPATAGAASRRSTLGDSRPSWATPSSQVGSVPNAQSKTFWVYLKLRDSQGLDQTIAAVSDPSSPSYGQYLTPGQFDVRYAPTSADLKAVRDWLRSQGMSVSSDVPDNNRWLEATGDVSKIEKAFATQIRTYRHAGQTLPAPSGDLTVPSSIASRIAGVSGLDGSDRLLKPHAAASPTPGDIPGAPPSPAFVNAPPCSSYWGQKIAKDKPKAYGNFQAYAPCGYLPSQLQGAYGTSRAISKGNDGAGQTVAIIDAYASPTILQDVNQWSTNRGLPTMTNGQLMQVVPPGVYRRPQNPRQDPQGWYGEETLDVEAVHGMAPAARIVYVGAPNNYQDLDAALNHVVDRGLARIVTNSYGFAGEMLPPGYIRPYEDTLIQAAAEGIGVYFSSGDNGDETANFGFASTDWPASSPWVTAVGGTSLGVSQANTRALETGWGTSNYNCDQAHPATPCARTGWLYGSGGGVSRVFAEPAYQRQAGLNLTGRGVPDVAAVGDPQTGLLVGQTQTFPDGAYYDEYRIGGTSLASPIFAGLMALADQAAGHAHGFANPLFYAHASAFYDVLSVKTAVARRNFVNNVDASAGTVDRLRTFDDYSGSPTQHTNAGWDNVTGLGTPGAAFLATFGH